jgi:hypothetical protein
MAKLLIYGNRKQDDDIWDISTPELEEAAYRELFKTLDGYWGVYADLAEEEPKEICEPCSKDLHRLCEDTENCACEAAACSTAAGRHSYEKKVQARWPELYKKAKAGEFAAMKTLMTERSQRHYEYEEFRISQAKQAKTQ